MTKAIALTRDMLARPAGHARFMLVAGCALALILAERAFPAL